MVDFFGFGQFCSVLFRDKHTEVIIYDCEDFEVIRRIGIPDLLLITFSALGMFNSSGSVADGKAFWAQGLAEELNYSAVGFVAKKKNWFCSPHIKEGCAAVASLSSGYSRVVAYGSSMGGYAALRFGRQTGATAAIAFAPQYSIDPMVVGAFDRRYEFAFKDDLHRGMEIDASDCAPFSVLFFDPLVIVDRKNAELFQERVPAIHRVSVSFCGSECIRVFAEHGLASQMIKAAASSDVTGLQTLTRRARKTGPIRAVELANRSIKKPKLARRIFEKYQKSFEVKQKALFTELFRHVQDEPLVLWEQAANIEQIGRSASGISCLIADSLLNLELGVVSSMQGKSPRIIHLHVPKTAGTALRTAFERHFKGKLRIFPYWDESRYTSINPEDFDFYSGHIGFDTASRLRGQIVTVLRHPVDRFLSVYYFWRQLHQSGVETTLNTELASKYSLDEFVQITDQPGLIEEFQNRCTFQIAHGSSLSQRRHLRLQGLTNDSIFRFAVANLEKFEIVGIQEDMPRFCDAIRQAFGVPLEIGKINVTKERLKVSDISIKTLRAIQDWVYMDMELYQHALRRI